MLIDTNLELSSAQDLSVTGAISTNIVDLIKPARQIGAGKPIFIHFNVTTAAASGASGTYQFAVETDTTVTGGDLVTANIVLVETTIPEATLVTGYKFTLMVPTERMLRYLGVRYTLGGTTPTISMDAFVSDQEMQNSTQSYADALAPVS